MPAGPFFGGLLGPKGLMRPLAGRAGTQPWGLPGPIPRFFPGLPGPDPGHFFLGEKVTKTPPGTPRTPLFA